MNITAVLKKFRNKIWVKHEVNDKKCFAKNVTDKYKPSILLIEIDSVCT